MRRFALTLFLFAIAIPRPARADEASVARADALFQEGRAAVREGNWEAGCPKFAESLRLDPAPGTRINYGECEERSSHLVAAFELYDRAIRELPADDRRLPLAKQRAQAVDARIPRLIVPADATARIDDAQETSGEVRVDPGRHRVVVTKNAREHVVVVTVVERERRPIEGEPIVVATPPAALPTRKVAGYVTAGIGLAAVATGLVFGGLALHDKSVVDRECDADDACGPAGLDAKNDGRTFSTVSTIAVGVGLAAVAAGIFLIVTSKEPPRIGAGGFGVRF